MDVKKKQQLINFTDVHIFCEGKTGEDFITKTGKVINYKKRNKQ
jgi:hypothetical protein